MSQTFGGMGLPALPDKAVDVVPQTDDIVWSWGVSGETVKGGTQTSMDMKWYGNDDDGATHMLFDASANTLTLTGVELYASITPLGLSLIDDAELKLGTSDDAVFVWDGTNLILKTIADDKLLEIGDSASTQLSWDVKWYATAGSGAEYLFFDASDSVLYSTGVDLWLKDNDVIAFGSGASKVGDVSVVHDGTSLIFKAIADDAIIEFGDAATPQLSFDVKIYGNAAAGADYAFFDAGASQLSLVGAYEQVLGRSVITPVAKATSYTVVAADSGSILSTEGASGDINFTLPTLGAGLHYWFYNAEDFEMKVSSALGNDIIADDDVAASTVCYTTADNHIGSGMYFVCDGTKWLSFMMGAQADTTVTVT